MKTLLICGFIVCCLLAPAFAQPEIITQWNFNSVPPDTSSATGSLVPSIGAGTAATVGVVSNVFSSGTGGADPVTLDDTAWSTTSYPAVSLENKTSGVRFDVSTVGFTNISFSWSQKNSSTASRYLRAQYTDDGVSFQDLAALATLSDAFTNRVVDLSSVAAAANNPLFGIRLLTEFEYTAISNGFQGYVATSDGSAYGTGGTIRFDLVTVQGTPLPSTNSAPVILSGIGAQLLRVGQSTGPLAWRVMDAESPAAALVVSGRSSDEAVVPAAHIVFGGAGADRTVAVTAGAVAGAAEVTLSVTDPGGKQAHTNFTVTVLPGNTAPVISTLPPAHTLMGVPTEPMGFTVADSETAANALQVWAASDNPGLLPNTAIVLAGSGSNRTVTLPPTAGRHGVAPVTVSVSDGTNVASSRFALLVRSSPAVLLADDFAYADGSLLTNSAFLWDNRSGTYGQCQVTNGQVCIAGATGEDVIAALAGAPYYPGSNTVIYASFRVTALALPKITPGYFAHLDGSPFRARVFAGTTNAAPGRFRLFAANSTGACTPLARDLATNQAYRVVVRYDVDRAATRLWLDPAAESDAGAEAADAETPGRVGAFAFRQDSSVGGSFLVDDVRVGLSFAAVTGPGGPEPSPALAWNRGGSALLLQWTAAGWTLQSAASPGGPFADVPAATSPYAADWTGSARFFRLIKK